MKIIIYVIDCLRADHLSCYGYSRPTTPAIDALAADGVRFTNAFSPSTWTKPVATSLLTGVDPPTHGVKMRLDVMERDLPTLPELLKADGYVTLAISAIGNVSSLVGHSRGFDRFVDLYKDPNLRATRELIDVNRLKMPHEPPGKVVFPLAEDINDVFFPWLKEHADKCFFAFLWAMDPHDPYQPPVDFSSFVDPSYNGPMDGSRQRAMRARNRADLEHLINLYDSEIAYTDHHLNLLVRRLKSLGIFEETLLIVTGDHGEAFGDHGHMIHGHFPYEEIIRVPLIMKMPDSEYRGREIETPVSLVDIPPTVLDLAGAEPDATKVLWQGHSLVNAISGTGKRHEILFSETQATEFNNAVYSARTPDWKLVWSIPPEKHNRLGLVKQLLSNTNTLKELLTHPLFYFRRQIGVARIQLFNLKDDPQETENVAEHYPETVDHLMTSIHNWLNECRTLASKHDRLSSAREVEDDALLDHLRALGYID